MMTRCRPGPRGVYGFTGRTASDQTTHLMGGCEGAQGEAPAPDRGTGWDSILGMSPPLSPRGEER